MSETWFSDNFNDLSIQSGVNAGFQFEFYCQRCHDAYRTPFRGFKGGQASGWLGKAAGMFGGVLGEAEQVATGLTQAGWAKARDDAFQQAVADATSHFHRCARCHGHVCDKCFNAQKGLCYDCAPSVEVEVEAARNQGELEMASQRAKTEGEARGGQVDVKTDKQLVCPNCGAEAHGAKFCPECGSKLAVNLQCGGCGAELTPGTKFCPECGTKAPA